MNSVTRITSPLALVENARFDTRVSIFELSGRHRGIASLVFSHRGVASQRILTNFCAPFFKEIPFFFPRGDPPPKPRRTPAPEYCISSRKWRSFEVRGRGAFRKEGDGGEGKKKKKGKKDAQKVLRISAARTRIARLLHRIAFLCLALRSAPPHTRSPGHFGPGTPEESGKSTPGQGPKNAQRVRPGVSKESEKSLKPDFRALFGLRGALFGHFWGSFPGVLFPDSFRTLPGFRARRARETLCGVGPIASLAHVATHIASLPASRDMGHSVFETRVFAQGFGGQCACTYA